MELTVLGCSGSYAAPASGPCSGYLVRSGETAVWIDCGPGTFANLQRHLPVEDLSAVVITHRHPDHCTDIFGLRVHLLYDLDRRGLPVLAAPEVRERLEPLWEGERDTFAWDVVSDGEHREVGEIRLRFSVTEHPPPTVAVELADRDGRLVYTADTGPGWSAGVFGDRPDVLVAEATYQRGSEGPPVHLSAAQAGAMAREVGARGLVLTHLWPTLDPAASVAEAEDAFGRPVTLAAPHLRLRV